MLVPLWGISGTATGDVRGLEEAQVLVRARSAMAVIAMSLQQRAETEDLGADRAELAGAAAAFRHLNGLLAVIAGDDDETLAGEDVALQQIAAIGLFSGGFGGQNG